MTKGWGGDWVVETSAGGFIVCRSVVVVGISPTVTLEKQRLNMIGNLV